MDLRKLGNDANARAFADKEDFLLFYDSERLKNGTLLFEKHDLAKGKIIFSLMDLPVGVVFLTANCNELIRISNTKATLKGNLHFILTCKGFTMSSEFQIEEAQYLENIMQFTRNFCARKIQRCFIAYKAKKRLQSKLNKEYLFKHL